MLKMRFHLFVLFLVSECRAQVILTETFQVSYQIAGIFEKDALTQRLAFNESMRYAHLEESELQKSADEDDDNTSKDWRLEPVILQPQRSDSYSVWRELCAKIERSPIAILGPQNPISDCAVRDQCALVNVPHIQATWQPLDPDIELIKDEPVVEEGDKPTFKKIIINFYPPSEEISYAYAKLLKYYKWENFAVLYEDDYGLMRIQKILAEYTEQFPITVRKLDPNADNYMVFKSLYEFKEYRIILDCHVDRVIKYLNEARAVHMVNHYQHYILVSMDATTVAKDLLPFHSNITWLSLTDFDQLQDAQHFLAPRVARWFNWSPENTDSPPVTNIKEEALLMNDVANHVLKSLQRVEAKHGIEKPRSNLCDKNPEPWEYGALLQDEILKTQTMGVTGNIEFNSKGRRVNYTLNVNEIRVSERETVGYWESAVGGDITDTRQNVEARGAQTSSKHFIVISRKAKPYFYDKVKCPENNDTCVEESADEKYEGFSVDLVKQIFDRLRARNYNYTYSFLYEEDKGYGKYDEVKKKWDGLIGDLLDKKADLAVCDLTITEERKKVVDFSVPFMSLGISILYTKERKITPGVFSFLYPYTFEVWMYTATAYCVVSIVLFVCSRISPADWENPQPCDKDPEELENIWNFKNCTWLTMGSIMTQGCDILPKAIGSRWVCGMWWFFAVIVCQTYIAQLSASMTTAMENEPINSVEDLANQNKVLYGSIEKATTYLFFKNSKDKMYQRIYENMAANPAALVDSNDEGERRVANGEGKYAFFMESTSIDYKLKRDCRLKKVGGELDSKDYGIAMPANSPFRSHINTAILELKEMQLLDKIKAKWWEQKNGAKVCEEAADENDVEGDLEWENLIGAFLVLIVGLVFCLFITAIEFMNEVRNIVVREGVSHKEVFIKELQASLNFFQLQKPVLRNPSRAPSIDSTSTTENRKQYSKAIENFLDLEKDMQ
ncbi:glutamate receptor ionotropic, kainate 2-like [Aricia agestis]|uniref:glutamate receptor ionotropic, kainate 2-like n=1 Tax=Aricia agestis TaxID=91739 RepID=UPI001C209BEF|nr:glutamate receptor ionotropic, kainate 2-like [Aricia agestis]